MDVCVEIMGAVMVLGIVGDKELYIAVSDSQYLLTGRGCLEQNEHSDLEVRIGRSPEVFVLVYGSEVICLLVCSAFHIYEHYPLGEKKKLAELLCLKNWLFRRILLSSHMGTCCMEDVDGEPVTIYVNTRISSL